MPRLTTFLRHCLPLLSLLPLVPAAFAAEEPESDTTPPADASMAREPYEPNPYLAFLPAGAKPDMRYWQAEMERRARARRADSAPLLGTVTTDESEPNDTRARANLLDTFGTGEGEDSAIDVNGTVTAPVAPTVLGPFDEDDGAIPLASDTGLVAGAAVRISGTIGDGPYGSGGTGSGDHDFFRIPGLVTGQLLLIDVDTAEPLDDLDPFIAVYDDEGNLVALNEDEDGVTNRDSFLAIPATTDGDYYLSIAGSLFPFAAILSDPFDAATGFGVGSEGDYEVTIAVENGDSDWFAFDLETCDILGIGLVGAGRQVQLVDANGELVVASSQDVTGVFPPASPLPGGGRAAASFVAPAAGRYFLRVLGAEGLPYTLELRAFRQPRETVTEPKILFVDFDGAVVDPAIFTGPPGETTLSPLSDFLSNWGLGPGDEDAVIDGILAALEENLVEDGAAGPNPGFAVEIRNSRDHADPFGQLGVSRLIVGGSISELGLPTIGIAQSIDPGNFEDSETAVILLDLLSGSAPDPNSLNSVPLDPDADIIDLLGIAIGNIAAHEAGHYVGSFHTEQFNSQANLMDRGGNLPNTIGLGVDGIFGTADDPDVDFGADLFELSERFAGVEDTAAIAACGCTSSSAIFADGFESGDARAWNTASP